MNIRERIKNNQQDSGLVEFRNSLMDSVARCGFTTKEDIAKLVESELRTRPDISMSGYDLQKLITFLVSSVNAFEIITDVFDNEEVDTIYVNSSDCIIVESKSGIRDLNLTIADMDRFIEDIINNCQYDTKDEGRIIDAVSSTGVHFHIVMEPLVLSSPVMVVKKFYPQIANFQSLLDSGFIMEQMVDYLSGAVNANKSIVIKGLPNSGKTTLLNALVSKISSEQRVVLVSDFEELVLPHRNVVRCKSSGLELQELMKLLPNRVVVDSCVNAKFMSDLMKSGMSGLIITSDNVASAELNIPGAVIIELRKLKDGTRKIVSVCEDSELFRFDEDHFEDGKVMGKFEVLYDMPRYEATVSDDFELEQLANLSEHLDN